MIGGLCSEWSCSYKTRHINFNAWAFHVLTKGRPQIPIWLQAHRTAHVSRVSLFSEFVDEGRQFILVHKSNESVHHLPVLDSNDCGHCLHAVVHGNVSQIININNCQIYFVLCSCYGCVKSARLSHVVLLPLIIICDINFITLPWCQKFAGATPFGREVHHRWLLVLHHPLIEFLLVLDCERGHHLSARGHVSQGADTRHVSVSHFWNRRHKGSHWHHFASSVNI